MKYRVLRLMALLVMLSCILSACGRTEIPASEEDGSVTVTYKRTLGGKLTLEIFRPDIASDRTCPAMLVFHGGGWVSGSKSQFYREFSYLCEDLLEQGIAVIGVDYRLATDGRTWRDCLDDCEAAVGYVKNNARRFGIDEASVGVMGYSAGAHLALMTAVENKGIPVCVSLSGPTVMTFGPNSEYCSDSLIYYRELAFKEKDYTDGSPTAKLGRRCETAFILVNGKADAVIPYAHMEAFFEEGVSLRLEPMSMLVDDLTHSYASYPDIERLSEEIAMEIVSAFRGDRKVSSRN